MQISPFRSEARSESRQLMQEKVLILASGETKLTKPAVHLQVLLTEVMFSGQGRHERDVESKRWPAGQDEGVAMGNPCWPVMCGALHVNSKMTGRNKTVAVLLMTVSRGPAGRTELDDGNVVQMQLSVAQNSDGLGCKLTVQR